MTKQEKITKAKLVDGKVFVRSADGTYRAAEDRSDLARLRALTEEEIERQAEEDGTAGEVPKRVRISKPFEAAE